MYVYSIHYPIFLQEHGITGRTYTYFESHQMVKNFGSALIKKVTKAKALHGVPRISGHFNYIGMFRTLYRTIFLHFCPVNLRDFCFIRDRFWGGAVAPSCPPWALVYF